jgi:sensor histidine kinase regulating citrate/malate metabolism
MEEILAQKHLAAAEAGDLKLNPEKFSVKIFIDHLVRSYENQIIGKDKKILKASAIPDIEIETDRTILNRVTGNMLKNALEASKNDETVTIGVKQSSNELIFWVHNKAFIPAEIRYQIFKRSFSTKGTGRGLGTYSIKLLTENYLKGSVNVESTEKDGTTFSVNIPIK